jgi:hypothetical protein
MKLDRMPMIFATIFDLALECGDLSPLCSDPGQLIADQSGDKSPHSKV